MSTRFQPLADMIMRGYKDIGAKSNGALIVFDDSGKAIAACALGCVLHAQGKDAVAMMPPKNIFRDIVVSVLGDDPLVSHPELMFIYDLSDAIWRLNDWGPGRPMERICEIIIEMKELDYGKL